MKISNLPSEFTTFNPWGVVPHTPIAPLLPSTSSGATYAIVGQQRDNACSTEAKGAMLPLSFSLPIIRNMKISMRLDFGGSFDLHKLNCGRFWLI